MPDPLLLLDTGSPLVSVAVARDGAAVAVRAIEQQRSSAHLLDLIGEVLAEAGITVRDLGGIAALRGPGSFTGLRIGLATVLGLHQALGVPATALPSLQVMAALAEEIEGEAVIAAVDALRGDWSAQAFAAGPVPRPLGEMKLVPGSELPRLAPHPAVLVGFGVSRLTDLPGLRLVEPGPLAPAAARVASDPGTEWNPALLTSALYSRPPAISLPRPRPVPAAREA